MEPEVTTAARIDTKLASGPGLALKEMRAGHTPTRVRASVVENVSLLLRYRWLIVGTAVIVTVATCFYAFSLPNYYKATSVVLPARKAGGGMLDNLSSGLASTFKDLGMTQLRSNDAYSPLSLLASRELKEKLVRKYDFQKVYESRTFAHAVEEFTSNVEGEVSILGNFNVSFTDIDSVRAAAVANDLVTGMNDLNTRLANAEARLNRQYLERRFHSTVEALDTAEERLLIFQRKHKLFSLPEQAQAQLSAIAGLEQQRLAADLQLNTAEQLYGTQSSEAVTMRATRDQIVNALAELNSGLIGKAATFVPMSVLPEVALEYLRLTREVEVLSKIKAFTMPSYEQAKLDESKVSLAFLTVDKAVPPHKKAGPRRSVMLLLALVGTSAFMSIGLIAARRISLARVRFVADQATLELR